MRWFAEVEATHARYIAQVPVIQVPAGFGRNYGFVSRAEIGAF
jgi:hypothetical protein